MRRKELLILLLLFVALAPYFLLCFYALPYADDFCYAWSSAEPISFAGRFLRQYMGWSGRYSAHILLCNHPLAGGRMIWYHIADLVSLSLVLISLVVFTRRIFSDFFHAVIIALSILLFYLCYMPQLSDGVYWYTGVCNYELSSVSFILHLSFLMLYFHGKGILRPLYLITSALLLIASIGFNEVGAALIPAYYFFALVILYINKNNKDIPDTAYRVVLTLFFISCISFGFLVLAPGNHVRSNQYHTHFDFWHSVLFGSLQTARFIGTWLFSIPALGLSLLVLSRADRLPDGPVFRFDHRLIIALILFTVFMSAFLPYFTTGILGQHRTINYAFFYFIILWLWLLISLSRKFTLYKQPGINLIGKNAFAVMITSIVIMTVTANGGRMLRDFRSNTFTAYKQEFNQRQDNIKKHPEMPIPPLKNVPLSMKIVDAESDTTYWVNKAIKIYSERIEIK